MMAWKPIDQHDASIEEALVTDGTIQVVAYFLKYPGGRGWFEAHRDAYQIEPTYYAELPPLPPKETHNG